MTRATAEITPLDAAIGWIAQRERVVRHALRLRKEINRIQSAMDAGRQPVIVFTPQKTGSTAASHAVEQLPGFVVSKVHTLMPKHDWDGNLHRRVHEDGTILTGSHYAEAVRKLFLETDRPARVLVTVREPVGTNLSCFAFLAHRLWLRDKRSQMARLSGNELAHLFMSRFPHESIAVWAKLELEAALGINVLDKPFPHHRGWQRITNGRWDVLILRADLPDEQKAVALREFTGVPTVTVTRVRESGEGTGGIYARLKSAIRAHPDYIRTTLRTPYAHHFWTQAELDRFEAKWLSAS